MGPLEMLNPENVHASTEPFSYSRVKNPTNQHGLLLSWSHTLLDAHAGELVARYLLAYDHNIRIFAAPGNARKTSLWRAVAATRRYGKIIKNLVSGGFDTVTASAVPTCTRSHIQFSVQESEQILKLLQELSLDGFASSYFIAASAEALVRTLPRMLKLIVATPHDARKKGAYRYISPNQLSLVFFKIAVGTNKSVGEQTADILSQFAAFVRSGAHQAFTDFLAIGRYLPCWVYSKLLYSVNPSGFCSMYVSYLGKGTMTQDSAAQNSGLPTFSLHHFPPHFAKPGISVVFWWSVQRLNVSLVLGDKTLNLAQRKQFEGTLRELILHGW